MAHLSTDSGRTIRLGNLDKRVTEDILWELFVQAGPVSAVYMPKEHNGFAIVMFRSMIDAVYAMVIMNNIALFGKTVEVYHQYKEQYLLEEQELKKSQEKFVQASKSSRRKSSDQFAKSFMTPEQASGFGMTPSSDESDESSNENSSRESSAPNKETSTEEPIKITSWVDNHVNSTPVSPQVVASSVVNTNLNSFGVSPPPPPPKPPTFVALNQRTTSAFRTTSSLPPPPPGVTLGIRPFTSVTTPPPPPGARTLRVVSPAAPPPPPPPSIGSARVVSPLVRSDLAVFAPPPPPYSRRPRNVPGRF